MFVITTVWLALFYCCVCRYFYAVIGMEAFHGFDIQPSSQYADHFQYNCGIGFTNFRCSLLIVFQIVGGNNWNDIMNSVR